MADAQYRNEVAGHRTAVRQRVIGDGSSARESPPTPKANRLREKAKQPGSSFESPGPSYFQGFELRHESLRRLQRKPRSFFGSAHPTQIESIFRSVCPNLANVPLFFVAQLVAQLAEGIAP
jgi:hypothetical protein